MFKVQYAGPKVEISNHGVKYNNAKEDKYVYLMVALEILQGIDNDYEQKESYNHHFENKVLNDDVVHKILTSYEDQLEERVEEEERDYEHMIEHEIESVQNLPHLTNQDKEVWIKNIELMKPYRIQRQINKIYYGHCIQDIICVIKNKGLREITTPFNKDFFHVMNSINNVLSTDISGCDTVLKEENDKDGNMVMKLYVQRSLKSASIPYCI
jgi:hypothetical protein